MCNGGEMSRAFRRDIVQASRAAILKNSIVPLDLDIRTYCGMSVMLLHVFVTQLK